MEIVQTTVKLALNRPLYNKSLSIKDSLIFSINEDSVYNFNLYIIKGNCS